MGTIFQSKQKNWLEAISKVFAFRSVKKNVIVIQYITCFFPTKCLKAIRVVPQIQSQALI